MTRRFAQLAGAFAIAAFAAACAAPAAPDTTAEDTAAINALRSAWMTAYNAGDAAGLAALYTENASVMNAGEATVTGRAAIQAYYEGMFAQMTGTSDVRSSAMAVSGAWAYDSGEYSGAMTPKAGGDAMNRAGRYVVILQKDAAGTWHLARAITNDPMPPAPAMTPGGE
jgi:uncharacterized protein (TIGR02246 family)